MISTWIQRTWYWFFPVSDDITELTPLKKTKKSPKIRRPRRGRKKEA